MFESSAVRFGKELQEMSDEQTSRERTPEETALRLEAGKYNKARVDDLIFKLEP
jgi:hypothetical protein